MFCLWPHEYLTLQKSKPSTDGYLSFVSLRISARKPEYTSVSSVQIAVFVPEVPVLSESDDVYAYSEITPTIGIVVPGNTLAEIPFTAPTNNGDSAITYYTATGSFTGRLNLAGSSSITVEVLSMVPKTPLPTFMTQVLSVEHQI